VIFGQKMAKEKCKNENKAIISSFALPSGEQSSFQRTFGVREKFWYQVMQSGVKGSYDLFWNQSFSGAALVTV
jgi:hypothetical protein